MTTIDGVDAPFDWKEKKKNKYPTSPETSLDSGIAAHLMWDVGKRQQKNLEERNSTHKKEPRLIAEPGPAV